MFKLTRMDLSKTLSIGMTVTAIMFGLALSGAASASTVTVDGIREAGEYTGTSSGTKSLLWFNTHRSIYTPAAGNMNDLHWEINNEAGEYSLNLFFEVPTYARRMIWVSGCDYATGSNDLDCAAIPEDYLRAYENGSHHNSVKMDYNTQTGSEFFQLNSDTGIVNYTEWQDEDSNGTSDNLTWATSREYLLNTGLCTIDECLQFDRTASIELMWLGFNSENEALNLLNSISNMELHMSDEAVGLPAAVPVPAAVWFFGSALLGLVGLGRRKA